MADQLPARQAPPTPSEVIALVEQALSAPPPRGLVGRMADAVRYVFTGQTQWMAPGEPLHTVAPAGTPPRQMEFPISVNRHMQPRGTEAIGFRELRGLADNATPVRACIETVKDLHERFGAEVVAKEDKPSADAKAHVKVVQDFLMAPDGIHTLRRWLRMVLEDVLVPDAACTLIHRTRGGEPWRWEIFDGTTIKPLLDATGRQPIAGPAYEQIVYGAKSAEFTADELVYMPRNPRPHKIYGYSPTEQVMLIGNIAINREVSQLVYFTDGNIPDVFIKAPKEWTPDQLRQAQLWWAQMKGDLAARRGVTVVPEGGIQEYRQPPLKDEFDEWIWSVATYFFGLTRFHFSKGGSNKATAQVMQDASINEGLIPRQLFLTELLERLIFLSWGFTDVTVKWQEAHDPDPQVQAEIEASDITHGIRSPNEVRQEKGLDPVVGGEKPFLIAGNTVILLEDIAAGKYSPLDPAEQERIAQEAKARITGGGDADGGAPPAGPGSPPPGDEQPEPPPNPEKPKPDAKDEEPPAAELEKAVRGRTIDTVPKGKRRFWQAERAPVPPRARPNADSRGES